MPRPIPAAACPCPCPSPSASILTRRFARFVTRWLAAATRTLPAALTLPAAFTLPATAAAQAPPDIEILELAVRRQPKMAGATLLGTEGVELKLVTALPGKTIIGLDQEQTRLMAFTDDADTDLAKGAGTGFFHWVSLGAPIGGKPIHGVVRLNIRTKSLPAKAANRLRLDAIVVLTSADGTDQATAAVALTKGAKIELGPFAFAVARAREPRFGLAKWQVTLQSTQSLEAIQKLEFADLDGKPITTRDQGSGSTRTANGVVYTNTIGFPEKIEQARVVLTFYKQIEKVRVPVKVEVGLGM